MLKRIKDKVWELLQGKEVSLALLFDRDGRILWHRGRSVHGKTVDEASGFPKSLIRQALEENRRVSEQDVVLASSEGDLSGSAQALYLRSLLVLPVDTHLLLYLDSGTRDRFLPADVEVLRVLSELLGEAISEIKSAGAGTGNISGPSRAAQELRDLVARFAIEEEPVLLTGETGVGKSHVAQFIHRSSGRRGPLVLVHTPAIAASLFESELFGHRKGAFTGASESRSGLVEQAEGGTLLLDEISEVPPAMQAKLLHLVETRHYRAVGDPRDRQADIRIITTSNRDLADEISQGRFRSDLFYRLSVLPIHLPPLRERLEDLPALVGEHAPLLRGKRPTEGFWEVLGRHDWPGNVRELLQVLRRAGIQLPGSTVGREVESVLFGHGSSAGAELGGRITALEAAIRDGASFWDTAWKRFMSRDLNRDEMRELLARVYSTSRGSLRRLAESLNIEPGDYARLVSALHKYAIHPARDLDE